jgi:hypothetical protein
MITTSAPISTPFARHQLTEAGSVFTCRGFTTAHALAPGNDELVSRPRPEGRMAAPNHR